MSLRALSAVASIAVVFGASAFAARVAPSARTGGAPGTAAVARGSAPADMRGAAGEGRVASAGASRSMVALPGPVTASPAVPQEFPWHPYDGSFTFARIRYQDGGGQGFRRSRGFGGQGPGWVHDYPSSEHNFSKIVQEITLVRARQSEYGGNILTLDDPRLAQFPIAYMSEPGDWVPNDREAEGLRNYLLKGGFIFFDDFAPGAMYNLTAQMARVFPELQFLPVDGTEPIFDSFFQIDPATIDLPSYRGYKPEWWLLYEDNDRTKRILAVAGDQADLGEYWEFSDRGFYPIDLSNEAYKVGVNYLIYALTH
jgi:hypothetical protein